MVDRAAAQTGVSARRQRRWIAVNAPVEIFSIAASRGIIPSFIVKGGFAIEFRFLGAARSSRDLDLVIPLEPHALMDAAIEVLRLEWSGFTFRIKGQAERREHSFKFEVNALYQNRNWSTFEAELVFAEVHAEELVAAIDLTAFGLLRPSPIPCMTVEEQIAQKLHAVSDPSEDRPRDLIDIHLFMTRLTPDVDDILAACVRTFQLRATHQWPPNITIRSGWVEQIDQLIADSELALSSSDIITGVFDLLSRLVGFPMGQNFQYHFIVLQGKTQLPPPTENALGPQGLEVLNRMTQHEGWRLVQVIRYPSPEKTGAVLAVLEKPMAAT
jgi:hypothetical protein